MANLKEIAIKTGIAIGATTIGGGVFLVVADRLGHGIDIGNLPVKLPSLPAISIFAPKPEDPLDVQIREARQTVVAKETEVIKRKQLSDANATKVTLDNRIEAYESAPGEPVEPKTTPSVILSPAEATIQAADATAISIIASRRETRTAQAQPTTQYEAPKPSSTPTLTTTPVLTPTQTLTPTRTETATPVPGKMTNQNYKQSSMESPNIPYGDLMTGIAGTAAVVYSFRRNIHASLEPRISGVRWLRHLPGPRHI